MSVTVNESQKTLIFWGIAAVSTAIATFFAWPTSSTSEDGKEGLINTELFPEFKDPLSAASLKIVVFDEALGELKNFEVRRDKDTGRWTIPSRGGYPADAIDQMRDAANLMVGLKALDTPTDNVEDHSGMGVVEPKLEDLDVGDEGVGRLVTFKDENQKELASLIIGDQVRGTEDQLYVRKPGQDLVYAVQLDDTPLSTKFVDWIEEDLLQLSSIDIDDVEIKDYSASIGLQGVSLRRKYEASLKKDAARWELTSLKEYEENPLAPPKDVEVDPEAKLNSRKLNELGNALDDLKFVNVLRKPEGISANLRADKDFVEDNEAASQLADRGFIPVPLGPDREIEILSANGELTATTKDGVQYILRFGNVSGLSDEDETEEGSSGGVNRYLMVSTVVDEARFPLPDLKPIPQTLEDLDALDNPPPPAGEQLPPELNPGLKEDEEMEPAAPTEEGDSTDPPADETPSEEMKEESPADESAEETATEKETDDPKSTKDAPVENESEPEGTSEGDPAEEPAGEEGTVEATESGETEASGEGESTTVGGAQDAESEPQESEPQESEPQESETKEEAEPSADIEEKPADKSEDTKKPADGSEPETTDTPAPAEEMVEETEEEKLERLAATQEQITKENERKLDERKDKIEAARKRSRELNGRFADWYYVIPEETYTKLRVSRDDLFDTSDAADAPAGVGPGMPTIPGITPRFPQQ